MDRFHQSTTSSIYYNIIQLKQWQELTLAYLNDELTLGRSNNEMDRKTLYDKFQFYFIDLLNFPDSQVEIYHNLVRELKRATNLGEEVLRQVLEDARQNLDQTKYRALPEVSEFHLEGQPLTKVTIGQLSFEIPKATYNRMIQQARGNLSMVSRLLLRYYPLGPTTGYFWSMDRRLYQYVSQGTELPVIEGFASPFNYNLNMYCAAYPEDMLFGALGDFFTYVKHLDLKTRLIANPPYTDKVMTECSKLAINYVERVPGSEVILMYPYWSDHPSVVSLESIPHCQSVVFESSEYILHDYGTDTPIRPSMPIIFFVLWSPGQEPTITIAEISTKMAELVAQSSS